MSTAGMVDFLQVYKGVWRLGWSRCKGYAKGEHHQEGDSARMHNKGRTKARTPGVRKHREGDNNKDEAVNG